MIRLFANKISLVMWVGLTGCYRVTFDVEGSRAYMNGTINTKTPARVATLLSENPDLTVIELEYVPGSVDDDACRRIR